MKITKTQLKQIIKEEITKILNEDAMDVPDISPLAAADKRDKDYKARLAAEHAEHIRQRKAFESGEGVLSKEELLGLIRTSGEMDYMSVCAMKNYDDGPWNLEFEVARALGDANIPPFPPGFEHDSPRSGQVIELARAYIKGVFCPDRG